MKCVHFMCVTDTIHKQQIQNVFFCPNAIILFPAFCCRLLTIAIYFLFLFLVVIILLNVLIAQVSETYSAVQSTARASLLFHRSRFIARCEENTALWFRLWTFRWKTRHSSYHQKYDIESLMQTENTQRKVGHGYR